MKKKTGFGFLQISQKLSDIFQIWKKIQKEEEVSQKKCYPSNSKHIYKKTTHRKLKNDFPQTFPETKSCRKNSVNASNWKVIFSQQISRCNLLKSDSI